MTSRLKQEKQTFTSLVSFFGHQSQLIYRIGVLGNAKSSEIHQVHALLEMLKIEKAIFTLDALHCQKKQSIKLLILAMATSSRQRKNSQPCNLYRAIAAKTETKPLAAFSWQQKGHGHDTQCRLKVWEVDEWAMQMWPGLQLYIQCPQVRCSGW